MTEENPAVDEETTAVADENGAEEELDDDAKLKEAIQVETEEVGTLRTKLTITIPRETIDERLSDQFSELKRDAMVPGFRKGRAPLKLIEKRFGDDVGDEMVSKLVGSSYLAAVDKAELKTLGDPLIWARVPDEGEDGKRRGEPTEKLVSIDKALSVMELPGEGPMTFSCEVELRPEFELPTIEKIPVEKPKIEITDEDVSTEIDRLRGMRGHYAPVEDAVQEDDLVIADMTMSVDAEVIKEEKNVAVAARVQRVDNVTLDLGKALTGKKTADTVIVEGTFDDDHDDLEQRGKPVTFTFVIQDIKRIELPPLDGDFLEALGFESEKELTEHTRADLEARLSSVIQRGMRGQIAKYLLENTKLEVPSGLSHRQTDRLVARRMVDMYRRGIPEQTVEKQADELRARAGEETVNELKLFFVMEKIAEKMEIDVADDELNGAIAMIAQHQNKRFDRVRDELAKSQRITALYLQLRDDKILDALLAGAAVAEITQPKAKSGKKATAKSSDTKKSSAGGSAKKKTKAKADKPDKSAKTKKDSD